MTNIRKNFEFDPRVIETIQYLKDACGLRTETLVVEEAIVLLGWAVGEIASGRKIGAYDEKRQVLSEITSPALERAKSWRPQEAAAAVTATARAAG